LHYLRLQVDSLNHVQLEDALCSVIVQSFSFRADFADQYRSTHGVDKLFCFSRQELGPGNQFSNLLVPCHCRSLGRSHPFIICIPAAASSVFFFGIGVIAVAGSASLRSD
jgi:hypothetical protein